METSLSLPKKTIGIVTQLSEHVVELLKDAMKQPHGRCVIHSVQAPCSRPQTLHKRDVHHTARGIHLAGTARTFDSHALRSQSNFRLDVSIAGPIPKSSGNAKAIAFIERDQFLWPNVVGRLNEIGLVIM
jgi:hypothetical protein